MKWHKIGRIYNPVNCAEWSVSHAAVPIADLISGDLYRIYFGTRDKNNCASISFIEIDLTNPFEILRKSEIAILSKGELGTFDDSGVLPSWLLTLNGKKYLYYIGWNLGVTVPFRNFIGLAISNDDGESFYRFSKAPIMDRDHFEPHFFTNPCILIDDDLWRMWYLSCIKWVNQNGHIQHYYNIKYASSRNGVNWEKNGLTAIDFIHENEYAISRPCVIKEMGRYRMWYSYRGNKEIETYRIGYAESENAVTWIRKDNEAGIDVSTSDWDNEMICYPFVFNHKGDYYMLYNGNGYGKTGFGLAVLEKE